MNKKFFRGIIVSILMSLTVLVTSCGDEPELESFKNEWEIPENVEDVQVVDSSCLRNFEEYSFKLAVKDNWSFNYNVFYGGENEPVKRGPKKWSSTDTLLLPAPRNIFLANCQRFMKSPVSVVGCYDNGIIVNWMFDKTKVNLKTYHQWPAIDTVMVEGFTLNKHRCQIDSLLWVKTDTARILNPDTINGKYLVREVVINGKLRMHCGSPKFGDFKAIIRAVVTKDGSEPYNPEEEDELVGLERGDEAPECGYVKTVRDLDIKETLDTIFAIDKYKRPIIHRYSLSGGVGLIWHDTLHSKIILPKMSRIFMKELVFAKEKEHYKQSGKYNGKTFWSQVSGIYFEFPTSFEKSIYKFGGFSLEFNREKEFYFWENIAYVNTETEYDKNITVDGIKYKLYQAKHLFEATYSDGTVFKFKIPQEVCIKVENGGGGGNTSNPLASLEEFEKTSTNDVTFSADAKNVIAKNSWKHHINKRYRDGTAKDTIWETVEYAKIYLPNVEKRIVTDLNDFIKNGESWQPGDVYNGKTFWTIISGTKFIFPTSYEQRIFTCDGISIKLNCYGYWSSVNWQSTSIASQKSDVTENGVSYNVYVAEHKFKATYSNGKTYVFVINQDIWKAKSVENDELTGLKEKSGVSTNFKVEKTTSKINGIEDYRFVIERIYKSGSVDTTWLNSTTASIYLPTLPEEIRTSTDIIKNSQTSFNGTNYNGKIFSFVLSGTDVNFETSFEKSNFSWKGFGVALDEYGYWKNIDYTSSAVEQQLADRVVNDVKYNSYKVNHNFKATYSNGQVANFIVPQVILIKAKEETDDLLDTYAKSSLEWRGSDLYSVSQIYEKRKLTGEKLVETINVNLGWNVYGESLKTVYNSSHEIANNGVTSSSSTEYVTVSGCSAVKTKKVFTYNFGYFTSSIENTVITSLSCVRNGKTLKLAAADATLLSSSFEGFDQSSTSNAVSVDGNNYDEWPSKIHILGAYDTQNVTVNNAVNIRVLKAIEPTIMGYKVVPSRSASAIVFDKDWIPYIAEHVEFIREDGKDYITKLFVYKAIKNGNSWKVGERVFTKEIHMTSGGVGYPAASYDGTTAWAVGHLTSEKDYKEEWIQHNDEDKNSGVAVGSVTSSQKGVKDPRYSSGTYDTQTGVYTLNGKQYR